MQGKSGSTKIATRLSNESAKEGFGRLATVTPEAPTPQGPGGAAR